jgi:peptide/nickel transport system ATP-binding protein
MSPEEYEGERRVFGALDELDREGTGVRIPARRGASGEQLLEVLESVRGEDPDEPFWSGVRELTAGDDNVRIEWWEPVDPRLLPSGSVQVECHLYDEEALAEAERRRGAGVQSGVR